MAAQRNWFEGLSDLFVPIHPDGQKYLAIAGAAALIGFLIWSPLGWIAIIAAIGIALVYRDPERVSPLRDGLVVAPADGKVFAVEQVSPPQELGLSGGPRTRIAIIATPIDPTVTRAPATGKIVRAIYVPGAFQTVTASDAPETSERRSIVLEMPDGGEVATVQMAGRFARAIQTLVIEGDTVTVGQRMGFIRLGGRVDLYLPPGYAGLVAPGQRMIAGETVVCDLASHEPAREAKRD